MWLTPPQLKHLNGELVGFLDMEGGFTIFFWTNGFLMVFVGGILLGLRSVVHRAERTWYIPFIIMARGMTIGTHKLKGYLPCGRKF